MRTVRKPKVGGEGGPSPLLWVSSDKIRESCRPGEHSLHPGKGSSGWGHPCCLHRGIRHESHEAAGPQRGSALTSEAAALPQPLASPDQAPASFFTVGSPELSLKAWPQHVQLHRPRPSLAPEHQLVCGFGFFHVPPPRVRRGAGIYG